jgi:hypothetical protein
MDLSAHLFWDVDPEKVDFEENARWLIERVFSRGMISDVNQIRDYYGDQRILKEMLEARYLNEPTLNFFSIIYNTPKEDFRCYKLRQLNLVHSPF